MDSIRNSLVQLGHGINQMRFQATITKTSSIAVDMACNKVTKKMLDMASIPVATEVSVWTKRI
jgi:cyanophycin synthetase